MVSMAYEINNNDPVEKKRFIRKIFHGVAPTYDAMNRILSMGIDVLWRKLALRHLNPLKGKIALDVCCGTGDMSRGLHKKGARVISLDFCDAMICQGKIKENIRDYAVIADASRLPISDNSCDIVTIAFGIRNIPDLDNFLMETRRVLKPGGALAILELTRPERRIPRYLYHVYLKKCCPSSDR